MMRKKLFIILALALCMTACSFVALAEEPEPEQTWLQWHKSTGISDVNQTTGVATFTNSVNGDTSFARSDTKFNMNGFKIKLKYSFQDKTAPNPNANVAPPALNADNIETGYNVGFRVHLSSSFELNDTAPQICMRFMPYNNGDSSNYTTMNFWVSTGTGYDEGAWVFTKDLLAPFYWDESLSNEISLAKHNDGKFYINVNGTLGAIHQLAGDNLYVPYKNLETALSKFSGGQGYFMFWNNFSSAMSVKYAPKIIVEEIKNINQPLFTEGSPFGYEFLQSSVVDWGYDSVGKLLLATTNTNNSYVLSEKTAERSLMGIGVNSRLKNEVKASDYFAYKYVGANNSNVILKFTPNNDKTDLTMTVTNKGVAEDKKIGDVNFRWNDGNGDYAVNEVILFKEKANYLVKINGNFVDVSTNGLDSARISLIKEDLESVKLQFINKGNSSLIIDGFTAKLPASTPKGWVAGNDGKTLWDSDFESNSIVWAENGVFSAVYKKEPALLKNFGTKLVIDKPTQNSFVNIVLGTSVNYYKATNGDDAIMISLKQSENKTLVALRKYEKATKQIKEISAASVSNIDWNAQQTVPVQFGVCEGDWTVYVRGVKVALDTVKVNAELNAIKNKYTNGLAYLQLHNEGDNNSGVTFLSMLHNIPGSAVIDGILSNSAFPVFGGAENKGDLVMSFSKLKGDTIRIMNKQAPIDGFKMEFEMFASPKANMGHIVMALAINDSWHSIDTGIQFAITSSSSSPLSLTEANIGLSMTDAELGLSNTPLVNFDVPFNWYGANKLELKKQDKIWKLLINDRLFNLVNDATDENLKNPIIKDDKTVATTITQILDIIYARYRANYGYFQMWNNFGEFTLSVKDWNLTPLNKAPVVVSGIKKDFSAPKDKKVRLDLNKFFTDSDGQITKFVVDGGATVVDGHILEYTMKEKDEKKYINIRAYDNRDEFGLVRISISLGKLNLQNMNVDGEPSTEKGGCGSFATNSGSIVIVVMALLFLSQVTRGGKKYEI